MGVFIPNGCQMLSELLISNPVTVLSHLVMCDRSATTLSLLDQTNSQTPFLAFELFLTLFVILLLDPSASG